jgi:hypothetical protein
MAPPLTAQVWRLGDAVFDFGFGFRLGFGGVCNAASTARSNRAQASGSASEGVAFLGEASGMAGLMPDNTIAQKLDDYYKALGLFVHTFAEVESQMQLVLWSEAKVTPDLAKALFSGVRIDLAKSLINRARESKGLADHALLSRAFTQLTIITKTRNDILHYGAVFNGDTFKVSTIMAAHIPERKREFQITPGMLNDMTEDLVSIAKALTAYRLEFLVDVLPKDHLVKSGDRYITLFHKAALVPWRYKPAPPAPVRTPRLRTRRKHGDPPSS